MSFNTFSAPTAPESERQVRPSPVGTVIVVGELPRHINISTPSSLTNRQHYIHASPDLVLFYHSVCQILHIPRYVSPNLAEPLTVSRSCETQSSLPPESPNKPPYLEVTCQLFKMVGLGARRRPSRKGECAENGLEVKLTCCRVDGRCATESHHRNREPGADVYSRWEEAQRDHRALYHTATSRPRLIRFQHPYECSLGHGLSDRRGARHFSGPGHGRYQSASLRDHLARRDGRVRHHSIKVPHAGRAEDWHC